MSRLSPVHPEDHEAASMLLQNVDTEAKRPERGGEELSLKEEWRRWGAIGFMNVPLSRPEFEDSACTRCSGKRRVSLATFAVLSLAVCGALVLGSRMPSAFQRLRTFGGLDYEADAPLDKFEIAMWPLMATADKVGGWEVFRLSTYPDGTISLRTIHDKYFTAYKDGALTADSKEVGPKQIFRRHNNSDGTISLETYRNTYVTTKWDGTLRSDGTAIEGSECFQEEPHSDGSISLKTLQGKYVTAVLEPEAVCKAEGGTFPVLAMSDAIGAWETLHTETHRDGSVSFKTCHGTYLTVQDDGFLSANCNTVAVQQKFRKHHNADSTISLRTYLGSYITAQDDGTFKAEELAGPRVESDGAVRNQQCFKSVKTHDGGIALRINRGVGPYMATVRLSRDTEAFCPHQVDEYPVRAAGLQVGGWETFDLIENEDKTVSFHTFHGKYITVQANGSVSGHCDTIAAQQSFTVYHVDRSRGKIALRAYTGKYVTVHENGVLIADGNVLGEPQELRMKHSDGKVTLKSTKGLYFTAKVEEDKDPDSDKRVGASGGSDDECNTSLYAPRLRKPQIWDVSEELNNRCFDMLKEQMPEMTRGGKLGRNWCWTSLKESGCQLQGHLRSWHEMRLAAAEANFTPLPPDSETEFRPLVQQDVCDHPLSGKARQWSQADLDTAKAWFDANVAVQVLSVAEDKETRLKGISDRLHLLGIKFSVVEGVDLRVPGAVDDARREGLLPADFNLTRAQEVALGSHNDMGRYERGGIAGTLGSFLGHLRAQSKAIGVVQPKPLALTLEDDAYPSDDFVLRLWRLVTSELPCDWQVASLDSRCPLGFCASRHLVRVQPDPNEPAWRCHHGVNQGSLGLLYRSCELRNVQRRWRKLSFDEERPRCLEVDTALAALSADVAYYAVPASQVPGMLHERWFSTPTRLQVNRAKQYEAVWA